MKLHRLIDLIEEKCSAQDKLFQASYFWSFCPLFINILEFCPEHNSKSIQTNDL